MKMLCCDEDIRVCNELREVLESYGIRCVVKNDTADPVLGEDSTPLADNTPQLWVRDDHEFERAIRLIHSDDLASDEDTQLLDD